MWSRDRAAGDGVSRVVVCCVCCEGRRSPEFGARRSGALSATAAVASQGKGSRYGERIARAWHAPLAPLLRLNRAVRVARGGDDELGQRVVTHDVDDREGRRLVRRGGVERERRIGGGGVAR